MTSLCADRVITPTRGQYSVLTLPTDITMPSILGMPGIITHSTRGRRGADTRTKREKGRENVSNGIIMKDFVIVLLLYL